MGFARAVFQVALYISWSLGQVILYIEASVKRLDMPHYSPMKKGTNESQIYWVFKLTEIILIFCYTIHLKNDLYLTSTGKGAKLSLA